MTEFNYHSLRLPGDVDIDDPAGYEPMKQRRRGQGFNNREKRDYTKRPLAPKLVTMRRSFIEEDSKELSGHIKEVLTESGVTLHAKMVNIAMAHMIPSISKFKASRVFNETYLPGSSSKHIAASEFNKKSKDLINTINEMAETDDYPAPFISLGSLASLKANNGKSIIVASVVDTTGVLRADLGYVMSGLTERPLNDSFQPNPSVLLMDSVPTDQVADIAAILEEEASITGRYVQLGRLSISETEISS